jgi:Piwi domain
LVIIPSQAKKVEFYAALKFFINAHCPVISQFVHSSIINKDKDAIFMNILRQINVKLGGDLWRMSFGKEISKNTMLVGIDVCHKGKQSVIGFCATYDTNLCKYYTKASPQPKKG